MRPLRTYMCFEIPSFQMHRFNMSLDTDLQSQEAASRRMLWSGQLRR
jgi:hypothetical protein